MLNLKVGDKVSKGFNGDCYPEGEIVRITPTGIVKTNTGETFRPVKGGGHRAGGTWWLVPGHVSKQNPSF